MTVQKVLTCWTGRQIFASTRSRTRLRPQVRPSTSHLPGRKLRPRAANRSFWIFSSRVLTVSPNLLWMKCGGSMAQTWRFPFVVHIGPGILNASDYRNIAGTFSWGSKAATTDPRRLERRRLSGAKEVTTDCKGAQSHDYEPTGEMPGDESGISPRVECDQKLPTPAGDAESKTPVSRHTASGSEKDLGIDEKLRRDELKIVVDIKRKLQNAYPENTPPYYRLAPERSAPGAARNDTSSPKASFDAATQYLHRVEEDMREIGKRILSDIPVQAR